MNRRTFLAGAGMAASGLFVGTGLQHLAAQDPSPTGTATATASMGTPIASPAASPNASPVAPDFTVYMKDIFFVPKAFTIPANKDVTILIDNKGMAFHTFTITELDIDVELQSKKSKLITLNVPPGNYTYFCAVPGHNLAGMHGVMTAK